MYGNDFDNAQTLIQRFVLTNPQIPQTPTQSPEPHFKSPPLILIPFSRECMLIKYIFFF